MRLLILCECNKNIFIIRNNTFYLKKYFIARRPGHEIYINTHNINKLNIRKSFRWAHDLSKEFRVSWPPAYCSQYFIIFPCRSLYFFDCRRLILSCDSTFICRFTAVASCNNCTGVAGQQFPRPVLPPGVGAHACHPWLRQCLLPVLYWVGCSPHVGLLIF